MIDDLKGVTKLAEEFNPGPREAKLQVKWLRQLAKWINSSKIKRNSAHKLRY